MDPGRPSQGNSHILSVILPIRNESKLEILEQLLQQTHIDLEIIVSDSGGQENLWSRHQQITWISSLPGRGRQMNAAARIAQGRYLFFLHADSVLPSLDLLAKAVACLQSIQHTDPRPVAGHFPIRFVPSAANHFPTPLSRANYRFHEEKSRLNRPGCQNGDQGLLLSRALFHRLGGFDESLPFLEDQRLANRIHALGGHWITLPGQLHTSARRFEQEGYVRRTLLNALILIMNHLEEQDRLVQAPTLYAPQEHSHSLRLSPFFQLFQPPATSFWTSCPRWWKIARYIQQQGLWQIFFYLDITWIPVHKRTLHSPFLAAYDRLGVSSWPLLDILIGILAWIGFHGLRLWFTWKDRPPS